MRSWTGRHFDAACSPGGGLAAWFGREAAHLGWENWYGGGVWVGI